MAADRPAQFPERLRVDTYQVQKSMYLLIEGELKKTCTLGLSPLFGSRFAAAKAPRKIRKNHSAAKLEHARSELTAEENQARFALLPMVLRPGEQH